jgi:hypothetical protein
MSQAKYIIIESGPFLLPVVFSELQTHADVARALSGGGQPSVVGAGFCHIDDDRYVCYGESVSLKVKSRGDEDSKLLNSYLGGEVDILV